MINTNRASRLMTDGMAICVTIFARIIVTLWHTK